MAHKKSGGAKARQGSKPAGKRLGVKIFAEQNVLPGQIIIRQRGTKIHSGVGTGLGRDHTVFAKIEGKVQFKLKQGKKFVLVDSQK